MDVGCNVASISANAPDSKDGYPSLPKPFHCGLTQKYFRSVKLLFSSFLFLHASTATFLMSSLASHFFAFLICCHVHGQTDDQTDHHANDQTRHNRGNGNTQNQAKEYAEE